MAKQKEFDHVGMMGNPLSWPWFVLPIKRTLKDQGWPQVGLLLGNGPKVYLCGMYDKVDLNEVEVVEYKDFQAMFDDGWRVD